MCGHLQVDETRPTDVCSDELGRRLDRAQEQREVSRRRWSEAELVIEHMPGAQTIEYVRLHRCALDHLRTV